MVRQSGQTSRLLEPMLEAGRLLVREGRTFLIPVAASLDREAYERVLEGFADLRPRVRLIENDYYEILHHARGAVVCSGTATLETALAETPEVVVYRTSWLTYNLGKLLVRISNIALVNVVAGRTGVPELIQHQVTPEAIVRELEPLLAEGATRDRCLEFLREVRGKLGDPGASRRAARALLERISERSRTVQSAR